MGLASQPAHLFVCVHEHVCVCVCGEQTGSPQVQISCLLQHGIYMAELKVVHSVGRG